MGIVFELEPSTLSIFSVRCGICCGRSCGLPSEHREELWFPQKLAKAQTHSRKLNRGRSQSVITSLFSLLLLIHNDRNDNNN